MDDRITVEIDRGRTIDIGRGNALHALETRATPPPSDDPAWEEALRADNPDIESRQAVRDAIGGVGLGVEVRPEEEELLADTQRAALAERVKSLLEEERANRWSCGEIINTTIAEAVVATLAERVAEAARAERGRGEEK